MFAILKRWGFDQTFLNIIEALYSSTVTQIRLQGFYSQSIPILRGTKQGCPLSPLIFATAIQTLAIAIREHPDIQGVNRGPRQQHKIALYADDLLVFVTSPITSLPTICRPLEDFNHISGLHVNFSKSLALNVSIPNSLVAQLKENFPFEWRDMEIPFLGITLTAKMENLYRQNYPPLSLKN